jgi:hypothetical protein
LILTAHQPLYLPWLGLFHKIASSDSYCYLDTVQYAKQDWHNRNFIKTAQGRLLLTVPVKGKGYMDKSLNEIEIQNDEPWGTRHWQNILHSYRKAPYFQKYAGFFEEVYKREWKYLSELNGYMLDWFLKELGIAVSCYKASNYDFVGKKSDLLIDICQKLGADTYLFGAQGKTYAQEDEFTAAGIKIEFQDYCHPIYPQLYGEFVPYLTVVDLLFNCGKSSLSIIMSGNRLLGR